MIETGEQELLCIVCPNGCRLRVRESAEGLLVDGNLCSRGIDFAHAEKTNPTRILTTTVRTVFSGVPALPVRTEGEIPKARIPELMRFLKGLVVEQALGLGDAAVENVLGLGIKVLVTSNILKEDGRG